MGTRKNPIIIDNAKCSPCSGLICVGVCPLGVLEAGENGKPRLVDAGSCNQCAVCVNLCPAKAITVNKESPETDKR